MRFMSIVGSVVAAMLVSVRPAAPAGDLPGSDWGDRVLPCCRRIGKMNETVFILNPAAGHGRAARVWEGLRGEMLRALPGAVCLVTRAPGHATELAARAGADGASRLVAVGGDGTFSEMLEGVMSLPAGTRSAVALGAVPAGSGCDLARHLGYPRDRASLVKIIAGGKTRAMDVGRMRYRGLDGSSREGHFVNMAAFGLAGDVAHEIKKAGKPLGGRISYAASSVRALLGARAKDVRLLADGKNLSGRYHLGVLANTSFMGGGMMIAPGARDDDGLMDLVLVADMSRVALIGNFPRLYKGAHLEIPGITATPVRRLEAEADETVYLNIDGEAEGMFPAEFDVLPRAVLVIAEQR
jgi:YegS/Rv2252/BmrU family lipid kinase